MENPAIFDDHKKEIAIAEALYFGFGCVWCPTLDDFVYFGKLGFRHLIRKGRKFRTRNEQCRRLALLPYTPIILKDKSAILDADNRYTEKIKYWTLKAPYKKDDITVVVMQIKQGKKYFVSIYAKSKNP